MSTCSIYVWTRKSLFKDGLATGGEVWQGLIFQTVGGSGIRKEKNTVNQQDADMNSKQIS